jgi:hypothetical protein
MAAHAHAPLPLAEERLDEWLAYGNSYIGKRIRRSVLEPGAGSGHMSAIDGQIRI